MVTKKKPELKVIKPNEKTIERTILEYLNARNIFAFKVNTTGVWDPKKKVFRLPHSPFILRGVADILGIFHGRFLAIECKTPQRRKQVSEHQQKFLETIRLSGGIAFVATSLEDVIEQLEEYM